MDEAALVAQGAVGADEDVIGYRLPEYLNLKSFYRILNKEMCRTRLPFTDNRLQ